MMDKLEPEGLLSPHRALATLIDSRPQTPQMT
jgi:hypothetical protein